MRVCRNIHKLVALSVNTVKIFFFFCIILFLIELPLLSINSRVRWDGPALQSLWRHCVWFPLWSARMRGLQGRHLDQKTNDVHNSYWHIVHTISICSWFFFVFVCFFSPGFFSPQHSAKHQLQDVCEEWELSHHAHEPQPVPALPLQEMPVCGHVERRWDIPTFNESFATVLWSAQRRKEKRSPKAAQPQYVGLCIKKTPLRKSFEVIMPVAHSLPHADSRPAPVFPLSVSAPPTLATWPFSIFSLVSRCLSLALGTIFP